MKALGFNQLKVHRFQSSGFRYVNLHPYSEDVFLNVNGGDLRGHNANALSLAMLLKVPGDTLTECLEDPANAYVKKQVRRRICRDQCRRIAIKLAQVLRVTSNIKMPALEAVNLLEQRLGPGIFARLPMLKHQWMELRAAQGDEHVVAMSILGRAAATYKFNLVRAVQA